MKWADITARRTALIERVQAGEITLAEAQREAREQAPLPPPQNEGGFAGMTAAEMCGAGNPRRRRRY